MNIQLVNPGSEELKIQYEEAIGKFIKLGMISLDEWNKEFKDYRDESGYSIIHYLEAVNHGLDVFLTLNPIMLKNRNKLIKRFKVQIFTPEEFMKESV